MIGARKTKPARVAVMTNASTTLRVITPAYQRSAARRVPAPMKMRAYVVPAMVPPVRSDVAMRDTPSAKRDESPSAGRGLPIRIPATPVLMSAKMIPAIRRNRSISVTGADTGREPGNSPDEVFWRAVTVVSGAGVTEATDDPGAGAVVTWADERSGAGVV